MRKFLPLLATLTLCVASATDVPAAEIQKMNSLQLDLRTIVLKNLQKVSTYPITKKRIPEELCTSFYNEVADFHNKSFMSWANDSKYSFSLEGQVLKQVFDSAFQMVSSCDYEDGAELVRFEMYNSLFDRDVNFLTYLLDSKN